jgi:hypothetical protein
MNAKHKAIIEEIEAMIISLNADKQIVKILGDKGIEGLNTEAHFAYLHYKIDKMQEVYNADYTEQEV